MDAAEIDALQEDDEFNVYVGSDIWLMDNHKWAFYDWFRFHVESGIPKLSLVHADYHWDGGNNFHESPEKAEEFLGADDEDLFKLIREGNLIGFDSFIAPAILRGFIDEVHFFCKQDDGSDIGIDDGLLAHSGTKQFIHHDAESLSKQTFSSPLIFDLCLDLFNNSDMWHQGEIWPDHDIRSFLDITKPLIKKARLVTVSLSFGYSGTKDDTRRILKMVLPMLKECRS